MQSPKILSRHGINNISPHPPPNLGVFVQDTVIRQVSVNTHQRVEQVSNIDDSSREAEPAAVMANSQFLTSRYLLKTSGRRRLHSQWVAEMCRISRKHDSPNTETWCTPLLQFVGIDIGDGILVWLGVTG